MDLDSEELEFTKKLPCNRKHYKIKKSKKQKIFELIGKIVIIGILYLTGIQFIVWAFLQNTIY